MSIVNFGKRFYASEPSQAPVDVPTENETVANKERTNLDQLKASIPSDTRFIYPEFLPQTNMKYRHPIREKIERQDMLNRRYVRISTVDFKTNVVFANLVDKFLVATENI